VNVPCDLCGDTEQILLFDKEGFRHVRCQKCGLVFVNPRLGSHQALQRTSGTGAMGETELTRGQRRRFQKELKVFAPYRELNRILEVGAGRGWFLEQAARAGWETWAVEINSDALAHLRRKGISHILTEPAEAFDLPSGLVDGARVWDVIEHLESPRSALERIHAALRPGGILRLSTTNFASLSRLINGPEWVYLNGADHIHLFEPRTISMLLSSTGFSDIRIRTRSFNLRRKLYHPPRDLAAPTTWLRPFRKIIDELIRFSWYGHQMIVTAVRSR